MLTSLSLPRLQAPGELEVVQRQPHGVGPGAPALPLKQSPMGNHTAPSPGLQALNYGRFGSSDTMCPQSLRLYCQEAEFCQGTRFGCQRLRPQESGKDRPQLP